MHVTNISPNNLGAFGLQIQKKRIYVNQALNKYYFVSMNTSQINLSTKNIFIDWQKTNDKNSLRTLHRRQD